ncbi:AAA family ATPase [Pseudomonas luteola]
MSNGIAPDRLSNLADRLDKVNRIANQLEGKRTLLIEQKASALIDIQNANHYLQHKDEVLSYLNQLQESAQRETKAAYEDLLTSLIREVLPNKIDRVVFETSIKNNKMALEINVNIGDKMLNVTESKGGTIQNILAMGLRFITVARSRNRKIILLDESDQWLKTKYIPRFAKIIHELSQKLQVQVVYISHHSPDAFGSYARIIKLVEKNGHVYCLDDAQPNITDEDVGVRSIRLKNYKNHTDTLINLDKYVTVITGEGDIGKSSVIQAFSVIMENKGRDDLVRNDGRCEIELSLEEGMTLSYRYDLKKESKTQYCLYDEAGVPVHKSTDGRNKPEWLDTYLAMPKLGDLDIHISRQDACLFVLSSAISAQKRAEILSLDNEAEYVQKMIKLHSDKIAFYKRNLNALNKALNDTKNELEKLANLSFAFDKISISQNLIQGCRETNTKRESIVEIGKKLAKRNKMIGILRKIDSGNAHVKEIEIAPLSDLHRVITTITKKSKILSAAENLKNITSSQEIEITPISELWSTIHKLDSSIKLQKILSRVNDIEPATITELYELNHQSIIVKLQSAQKKREILSKVGLIKLTDSIEFTSADDLSKLVNKLEVSRGSVSSAQSNLRDEMKVSSRVKDDIAVSRSQLGKCPLCDSDFHIH